MSNKKEKIIMSITLFIILIGIVYATTISNTNTLFTGDVQFTGTFSYNNITMVERNNATDVYNKITNAQSGDTIYIPKGTYVFDTDPGSGNYLMDITTENLTISGDGTNTKLVFDMQHIDADRNFIVFRGDNVVIKNLFIKGFQEDGAANSNQTGTSLAITGRGGLVKNIHFMDGGYCLYYSSAEHQIANNLFFYNCEQPLGIVDNSKGIIVNNMIATIKAREGDTGWIQRGIILAESGEITLSNIYVDGAVSGGMYFFGYAHEDSKDVIVNNYIFNGTGYASSVGIQSWGYEDVLINGYKSINADYGLYFVTRQHSTLEVDNITGWQINNFDITGSTTSKGIYFQSVYAGNTHIKDITFSNGVVNTYLTAVRFVEDNPVTYENIRFDGVKITSIGDNAIRIKKNVTELSFLNCDITGNTYSIQNAAGNVNTNSFILGTKLNLDSTPTITDSSFGWGTPIENVSYKITG